MDGIHVAALFPTAAEAHAAQAALLAAGVAGERIAIIDGAAEGVGDEPAELWGTMKEVQIPDDDAHVAAEAVSRGHTLLVAHLAPGNHDAALAALHAAGPLNLEEHAEALREEGWDGTYEGQDEWLEEQGPEAAGSEGITAGGVITGDYGSVGRAIGGNVDTDILRGKHFLSGERHATRIGGHGNLRVYEIR